MFLYRGTKYPTPRHVWLKARADNITKQYRQESDELRRTALEGLALLVLLELEQLG